MKTSKKPPAPRGIILLVVLGILGVLSVIAIAFVQVSRLERAVSRNYVDRTRAVLAAESGVEYTLSRLRGFRGGALLPDEISALEYNPADPDAQLDDKNTIPSFAVVDGDGTPLPYSGDIGGTYIEGGDRFKLHVIDGSGKLNLNDSNGAWNWDDDPLAPGVSGGPIAIPAPGRLSMMVERLGEAVFGDRLIGTDIAVHLFDPLQPDSRPNLPGDRFTDWQQVQDALVPTGVLQQDEYQQFLHHVTLHSWQDQVTLRPNYQLAIWNPDSRYTNNPPSTVAKVGFEVYLFRDFQNSHFETEPRCPVNVNTASVELLQALVTDISGWFLREGPGERASHGRYGNWANAPLYYDYNDELTFGGLGWSGYSWDFGKNNILGLAMKSPVVENPTALAQAMFERIHGRDINGDNVPVPGTIPNPIETWEELDAFLRIEVDRDMIRPAIGYVDYFNDAAEVRKNKLPNPYEGNSWADDYERGSDDFGLNWGSPGPAEDWWENYMYEVQIDALLANFNPNARSNQFSPNRSIFARVDKSHLLQYTSELCFEPTGMFDIESLGQVFNAEGEVMVQAGLLTTIRAFEYFRHSTQEQFMGAEMMASADLPNLDDRVGGPFRESKADPAAGAGLLYDAHNGFTLQLYPEPLLRNESSWFSPFDGYLMLAVNQRIRPGAMFHQHFNGSLKPWSEQLANTATDNMMQYGIESDGPMLRNVVTLNALMPSKPSDPTDRQYPGHLYPDGAYSEIGSVPNFDIRNVGSDGGCIGAMEFWTKPNYHAGITSRVHRMLSLHGDHQEGDDVWNSQFSLYYYVHDIGNEEEQQLQYPQWGFEDENIDFEIYHLQWPGWIPTHCMAVGWGGLVPRNYWGVHNVFGRWTNTANHDYPSHKPAAHFKKYNFEGHSWNHIALSWNIRLGEEQNDDVLNYIGPSPDYGYISPPPGNKLMVLINGHAIPNANDDGDWPPKVTNWGDHAGALSYDFHSFGLRKTNRYLRLGEVSMENPEGDPMADPYMRDAYSADALYDDVITASTMMNPSVMADSWHEGRYYSGTDEDAFFTSPKIDVHSDFQSTNQDTLHLRSVAWSLYWPKYNRKETELAANFPGRNVNDAATDPMDGLWNDGLAAGAGWDPISIDISIGRPSEPQTWLFQNSFSDLDTAKSFMPASATGTNLQQVVASAGLPALQSLTIPAGNMLQYRIYFNYDTTSGIPFYESPVLDDISFTMYRNKPDILSWRVNIE